MPNLATASSILGDLLADQTISNEDRLKATRLRFKLLDRIGDTSGFDSDFSALSATDATLSNADWDYQKKLWTASHEGAQHDWDAVRTLLIALPDTLIIPGAMEADLHLLHCNAAIRSVSTRANGFRGMADVVVESNGWTLDSYELDPKYGQEELLYIDDWDLFEEVCGTLKTDAIANMTARRRWLDLAAPSRDPRQNDYPASTPAESRVMRKAYHANVALWTPDPQQLPAAVEGYRELYEQDLLAQDYFRLHRSAEFQTYIENLPASITGIPSELYDAYKTYWQVLCYVGGLRLNDVQKAESAIDSAAAVLPAATGAFLVSLRGISRLHYLDARGLEDTVGYLATSPANQRLIKMRFRTMNWALSQPNKPDFPIQDCLDVLGASSETPLSLATSAMLQVQMVGQVDEADRDGYVHQAIVDGARALHHAELRQDPGQTALRERLGPLLAECIYARGGDAARSQMLAEFNGPVHENSALSGYLNPAELTAAASLSLELLDNYDAFEAVTTLIGEDGDFLNTQTRLTSHTDAELKAALDALPDALETRKQVLAARALLEEVESRGQTALGASLEEWEWARARSAELMLGDKSTASEASSRLASLAAQYDGSQNLELDRLAGFCSVVTDGLNQATTLDAYVWGTQWLITIEDAGISEMENLSFLVARPMGAAYLRADIQEFLSDPDRGPDAHAINGYYITSAMVRTGADLLRDPGGKAEAVSVYKEVGPIFNDLLQNQTFAEGNEVRMRIDQWQVIMWQFEALTKPNTREAEPLLDQIIERVRELLPGISGVGRFQELADAAIWAGSVKGDMEIVREFEKAKIERMEGP